jgi:hypothetical protein
MKNISPVTGSIFGCADIGRRSAPPKSYSPIVSRVSASISCGTATS